MRAGVRIGKYVLDERIAVGGMAEVWAARSEGPQGFVKPVALKFLLESFAGDPELERLFVNEARIAAQLQHANLVTVFDFDKIGAGAGAGEDPGLAGRYYIAMERVEGHDLRRIAEAAKRAGYVFPVGLALYLGGEVLKALRYVHERRERGRGLDLVHRDVSPHNVLVGYGGEVKLSDFGIAKTRAHTARGTKTGTVRGKLAYASPEQLNGEQVDHRTDQFALGVTLWEILAGRRLFDGHDELETIGQVVRCAIPPLEETGAGRAIPVGVEAVLRRMLAARRVDRYPSTAEALSALLALRSYTADGAALGELVRTLFVPSALDLPPTMPIQAAPEAAARLAETRTMNEHGRRTPAGALHARAPAGSPHTQSATRPQRPGARGSQRTTVAVGGGRGWSRAALAAGTVVVAALAAVAVGRRLAARDGRPSPTARASTQPAAARPSPPRASALPGGTTPHAGASATPLTPPLPVAAEEPARAPLAEKLLARAQKPLPPAPQRAAPPPSPAAPPQPPPGPPPPSPSPSPPPSPSPSPPGASVSPPAPAATQPSGKKPNAAANGAAILE